MARWCSHMGCLPEGACQTTPNNGPMAKRRWPLRIIFVPVAMLGLIGFFVNYTSLSFPFLYEPINTCHPKTNIVFLKTHKCAGSSIQNILMRYGNAHNLTFVLPKTGNYLGHPSLFSSKFVAKPMLNSYNIFAHHARLNYTQIKRLMPQDTVFITIVRDPVDLFESSFAYYNLDKFFGTDLKNFARLAPKLSPKFANRRSSGRFGTNQMMFDLGADVRIFGDLQTINAYIDRLESWFDFVLVAERMDESLVMLKEILCWSMDDVITFKLNARHALYRSNLSEWEKANLRYLNAADQILYDRFLRRFENQIDQFGRQRMAEESKKLRERTSEWYNFCIRDIHPHVKPTGKTRYYINTKVMVLEPRANISNTTCKWLSMEELPFTDHLRQKQIIPTRKPRYLARHPHV